MSWQKHLREGISAVAPLALFDYRSAGPGLARLDCNELALPPEPAELAELVAELAKVSLHRYPEVGGLSLRRALARRWQVEPDEILLGNGSVETISMLMTAFVGRPAGAPAKVLYPEPSFPYYEVIARTHGVVPLAVPLEPTFALDPSAFEDAIDRERPALALFASPNNPTGNRFDPAVLERLARRMDAVFVVDEAYADFAGTTMLPRVRVTPGLFVMRSLSKIGLAGLRLGALIGPRDAIAELDKVRLPWNINAVSLALGVAALASPERLEARVRSLVGLRRELEAALRRIPGLVVYPSEANFILVRVPGEAGEVFRRLLEKGVLVKNVSRPGLLERCLRITVGTSQENERCARALEEAVGKAILTAGSQPS
jgi:histidinol-phosphate aminotransferase